MLARSQVMIADQPTGPERHATSRTQLGQRLSGCNRALRRVVSSSNNENRNLFGVRGKVANLEGAALPFRG